MQKDESILINEIFRTKAKLSELSGQKRKITVQLESKKRSLKELEMTDAKMVYQKIDNVILPRDIVIVIKEEEKK
jgi:chaperonin cofactor prefoldin